MVFLEAIKIIRLSNKLLKFHRGRLKSYYLTYGENKKY